MIEEASNNLNEGKRRRVKALQSTCKKSNSSTYDIPKLQQVTKQVWTNCTPDVNPTGSGAQNF